MMKTAEIRQSFLDFFQKKGHKNISSSSLIPQNDATLLFTNAGMFQFKDIFIGTDKSSCSKAVTIQKCLRAGGKHNDLENVGYTSRHHTFFEMLGNFSFGDYFKKEAIFYAWEYLTTILKIPAEKLWVTVYEEDDDAKNIWVNEIGVSPERVIKIGAKDNFWSMGDTGPCGPCSEIFYDHGEDIFGGPPGTVNEDGDRYVEIWNIVFMQYNRLQNGSLEDLPNPSIDTGMGLERIAAVMQNKSSNYDIDLFQALIKSVANILNIQSYESPSLKVIADHIRACSFLICDGIMPSNEGRGYVLRRIIRRAVRHGNKLGANTSFFYKLVGELVNQMSAAYPELKAKQELIENTILKEENQFTQTLNQGMKLLQEAIKELKNKKIPGEIIFKLYDTYGFPVDLTADIAREYGLEMDIDGFDSLMKKQKQKAKSANKFKADYNENIHPISRSEFIGYESLNASANIKEIFIDKKTVDKVFKDQEAIIILDQTPFYAESGGQVGDTGYIKTKNAIFEVQDTQKIAGVHAHIGKVISGELAVGENISTEINSCKRLNISANHTATHLLHAALRKIIGNHVEQRGSLVESSKLRFDYSHDKPLSNNQCNEIENLVNQQIRNNIKTETIITTIDKAKQLGAMALFDSTYGNDVRVLKIDDFSIELCGGLHTKNTGEIGIFKIKNEAGLANGIRRIEAVTGEYAEKFIQDKFSLIAEANQKLKASDQNILIKIATLQQHLKENEKKVLQLKNDLISEDSTKITQQKIGNIELVTAAFKETDIKILRNKIDDYKAQYQNIIVALATQDEAKTQIIIGVSKSLNDKIKANELAVFLAPQINGKGGGRPDMAQVGGSNCKNLKNTLDSITLWLENKL